MAVQSSLKNMVLCLTAVCMMCSAILGVVYAVTEAPIKAADQKALEESIGQVLPEGGQISESMSADFNGTAMEYYVSTKDGATLAYAVKSTTIGFGGPLTLMVGILEDGTVYSTSVLTCSETPGLGAKCQTDEGFISQFRNLGTDKVLSVKKDGGDIDAITASTITSRAYTLAVKNAVEFVQSLAADSNYVEE